MPYRKWFHRFCLVVTGLFFFAGCGRAEPALPTLTGVPALPVAATLANPTPAQPLPTATLLPPTATTAPLTPTPWPQVIVPGPNDVHALLVLPDGLGPNWYLNADNFESYGWVLTLTGAQATVQPCPSAANWYGLPDVPVDVQLADIPDPSQYQVVAIMPATKKVADAYGDLLSSPAALSLLAAADQAGTALYASCGGVRVLAAATVLDGHQVTGEAQFLEEYQTAGAIYLGEGIPPAIDGNIVTAQEGLHYNLDNCEAIAAAMQSNLPVDLAALAAETLTASYEVLERDTAWTRTYGGSSADGAQALLQTRDGGFLLAGYTFSFGSAYANAYLVRTDASGNLLWSAAFGGPGWEYLYSVVETDDGGFVAAGYTTSTGAGSMDMYLLRVDAQGRLLWEHTFGGAGIDVAQGVAVDAQGDLILAGYTNSSGAGENDVYLVKTDPEGNELWSQVHGGEESDMAMDVLVDSQGNYLVAGATGSFGAENRDVYVLKLSPGGTIFWEQLYGHHGDYLSYEWGNDIIETSAGGYLVAGNSNAPLEVGSGELMNAYLVRIDAMGNLLWEEFAGRGQFYDYGNALLELPGGDFLVAGTSKTRSNNNEIFLARVSAEGTAISGSTFGDFGAEWGSAIALTPAGEVVLAGQTNSFGAGSFDIWMLLLPGE
ncbi:MAG TPA: DJ-1/PfpI family protein [Anaerolineales bacterium]|nr:DJ-1/PfpI family protein [Anaerolineales bacterium]